MGNVTVAWEDVVSVLNLVRPQLLVLIIALVAMIGVIVFALIKLRKPLKGFVSAQSVIAFCLVALVTANIMLTGPLYNTLNVILSDSGELAPET